MLINSTVLKTNGSFWFQQSGHLTPAGSSGDLPSHAHPDQTFVPFSGQGMRLDGKGMSLEQKSQRPLAPLQSQK